MTVPSTSSTSEAAPVPPTNPHGLATVPEGYSSVAPWVITRDTGAVIDFLVDAFDGVELGRMAMDDGTIGHAEVRIGDGVVLLFDAPASWPTTPAFVRLYVPDARGAFDRALAAGAEAVTEPTELFWGDEVGRVRDPLGNLWWLQGRLVEPTPEALEWRLADPAFAEAMAYVVSADLRPEA